MAATERRQRRNYLSELGRRSRPSPTGGRLPNCRSEKPASPSRWLRPATARPGLCSEMALTLASSRERLPPWGPLVDTVEELQEELRNARAQHRPYSVLTNHLRQAARAGLNTPEGRQRVEDAHAEALDPTPNKEWDW